MLPRNENDLRRNVIGGVIAGLVAGALLTAMMTGMSLAQGADIWSGMKVAAAPLIGERAMDPGFDLFAVWLGLMCHFAVSLAWSVPFALLFGNLGRIATIAAGAGWGVVVWIGMFYVVLPWVGLGEMRHGAPLGRAIAYHVFFGVAVAVAYLGYRREERRLFKRIPELTPSS